MDLDVTDVVDDLLETATGAAEHLRIVEMGAECLDDANRSWLKPLSDSLTGVVARMRRLLYLPV